MSIFSDSVKSILKHRYFFVFIGILLALMCALIIDNSLAKKLSLLPDSGLWQKGQLWRLISGHFIHASWEHFLLNIINLIFLRLVFSQWMQLHTFIIFMLFNSLAISVGLTLSSNLSYYLGFSGIFYSLLIYFLLSQWKTQRIIFSIAIVCVAGKIIHEQMMGVSKELSDFIDIQVAIDAHAWGLLSGSIFCLMEKCIFTQYFLKNHHIDTGIR